MIGTTVQERYRIDGQIGVGGMGVVYRAHDTMLDRDVAIKVIAPHVTEQEGSKERFIKEARSIARLSHPNIVTVHDLLTDKETGNLYLVMELLNGRSLRQRMAEPDRPTFMNVAVPLCKALECAHSNNILHRDIKPENVFVCNDGTIKLMDFGLARLTNSNTVTHSGMVAGTVAYMAPEQLRSDKLDERTDLYSLGILLYEYLNGTPPFTADNPGAVLLKHMTETPIPLRQKLPTLPPEIEYPIMRLLSKSPADRYSSAQALRDALEHPMPVPAPTRNVATDTLVAQSGSVPVPPVGMALPAGGVGSAIPFKAPVPKGTGKKPAMRTYRPAYNFWPIIIILLVIGGSVGAYMLAQQMSDEKAKKQEKSKLASDKSGKEKGSLTQKGKPRRSETSAASYRSGDNKDSLLRSEDAQLRAERAKNAALEKELKEKEAKDKAKEEEKTPSMEEPPPPPTDDSTKEKDTGTGNTDSSALSPQDGRFTVKAVAFYRPRERVIRVTVTNSQDCSVYFYAINPSTGQASRLSGSVERLSLTPTGRSMAPVDLTVGSGQSPRVVVMIASREELTGLPDSVTLPPGKPLAAGRALREQLRTATGRPTARSVQILLLRVNGGRGSRL